MDEDNKRKNLYWAEPGSLWKVPDERIAAGRQVRLFSHISSLATKEEMQHFKEYNILDGEILFMKIGVASTEPCFIKMLFPVDDFGCAVCYIATAPNLGAGYSLERIDND